MKLLSHMSDSTEEHINEQLFSLFTRIDFAFEQFMLHLLNNLMMNLFRAILSVDIFLPLAGLSTTPCSLLAFTVSFAFFRFLMLTLIIVLVPIKMSMQLHR